MYKIIPILVLVAVAHGEGTGDLDSVLSQIFGPAPGGGSTAQPIQDKTHASTIVPPVQTHSNTVAVGNRMSFERVGRRRNQGVTGQHCPDYTIHSKTSDDTNKAKLEFYRSSGNEQKNNVLKTYDDSETNYLENREVFEGAFENSRTSANNKDFEFRDDILKWAMYYNIPLEAITVLSTILEKRFATIETETDLSCKMPDGQEGECVSYYLCNVANNTVITDGVGVIDIRVRDGPCESYIDTCCLVPDKRPPDQPVKPVPKPDEPQREGCGWANPEGADLRTTGEVNGETKFGEFPWMVAILKIEPVNENEPDGMKLNVYVGGGSIIHPSVVLTAAHYVASSKALRIRAGEWDTQSTKEIYPFQDRDVAEVVTHKDFNKGNLFYDIAILFLAVPVELTRNVGVACLPQPKIKAEGGTRCFATGWGKDVFGKEGRYQVILKKIELPIVKHDKCQASLRKTRLGRFFQLHSTFMCAGGEPGKDTCKGDGGSPLSCPIEYEKDRYVQNGIVAWGIGCGEDGTPGVYVDVSVLREWIDDKVVGKGYDPQTYTY